MILNYEFLSCQQFSTEVRNHNFLLRCVPKVTECQKIISSKIEISHCGDFIFSDDGFFNTIIFGNIDSPHKEFSVKSVGSVEIIENQHQTDFSPVFKYPSPLIVINDKIKDFANKNIGATTLQTVENMVFAVNKEIEYKSGKTKISTNSAEVFDKKCGVCQDLSHVLIACLRSVDIPARYVCGYVKGKGPSHAWTEVFINNAWHAFDAVKNAPAVDGYVKIAHGRDALDCPLNRGIYFGNADETMTVEISVN